MRPVDSKSVHRPISKANEGKTVTLENVEIVTAGHVSSVIQIGPLQVRIGNAALRAAAGLPDL